MAIPCSCMEVVYTYSTPLMLDMIFSSGLVILDSTSVGLAPGYPTNMSAMGTSICGSSSLGIRKELYTPMTMNTTIKSTVNLELMNPLAIFPASPSFIVPFLGY